MFAKVITVGKKQILARPVGIYQKEKCG